jgi:hypothetical protein
LCRPHASSAPGPGDQEFQSWFDCLIAIAVRPHEAQAAIEIHRQDPKTPIVMRWD